MLCSYYFKEWSYTYGDAYRQPKNRNKGHKMLELMNYTRDTATQYESGDSDELQSYLDEHEGDEMGISHCDIIAINSLDEALELLTFEDDNLTSCRLLARLVAIVTLIH